MGLVGAEVVVNNILVFFFLFCCGTVCTVVGRDASHVAAGGQMATEESLVELDVVP